MTRTREIDAALRTLDAADREVWADDVTTLARLDAIVATDPTGSGAADLPAGLSDARRRSSRARTARRVGWATAVVAAATAALLVVPTMIGGGGRAFAGWTPQPEALPAAEQQQAVDDCRKNWAGDPSDALPGVPDAAGQLSSLAVVVTEKRGPWTTVLMTNEDDLWADCVSGPSGGSASLSWGGSAYTPPTPSEVVLVSSGYAHFAAVQSEYSTVTGAVGSDVTGVAYDSTENGQVQATVMNGYFVLWMPGKEWEGGLPAGTAVTVTLADGTSQEQVLAP